MTGESFYPESHPILRHHIMPKPRSWSLWSIREYDPCMSPSSHFLHTEWARLGSPTVVSHNLWHCLQPGLLCAVSCWRCMGSNNASGAFIQHLLPSDIQLVYPLPWHLQFRLTPSYFRIYLSKKLAPGVELLQWLLHLPQSHAPNHGDLMELTPRVVTAAALEKCFGHFKALLEWRKHFCCNNEPWLALTLTTWTTHAHFDISKTTDLTS